MAEMGKDPVRNGGDMVVVLGWKPQAWGHEMP